MNISKRHFTYSNLAPRCSDAKIDFPVVLRRTNISWFDHRGNNSFEKVFDITGLTARNFVFLVPNGALHSIDSPFTPLMREPNCGATDAARAVEHANQHGYGGSSSGGTNPPGRASNANSRFTTTCW